MVLRPARLEVGHYDNLSTMVYKDAPRNVAVRIVPTVKLPRKSLGASAPSGAVRKG